MAFKCVVFACLVAAACASTAPLAYPAGAVLARVETEDFDPHPQYAYGYEITDTLTGDFKSAQESRDGDLVQGSFSVVDPDGTRRITDYFADPINGFNAVIRKEPLVAEVDKVAVPVARFPAPAPVAFAAAAPAAVAYAPGPAAVAYAPASAAFSYAPAARLAAAPIAVPAAPLPVAAAPVPVAARIAAAPGFARYAAYSSPIAAPYAPAPLAYSSPFAKFAYAPAAYAAAPAPFGKLLNYVAK